MGGGGPESSSSMGPIGPNTMGGPVLNGDGLEGMKNSPVNGTTPGTPREDSGSGMGDYGLGGFGGTGENVSFTENFLIRFVWFSF